MCVTIDCTNADPALADVSVGSLPLRSEPVPLTPLPQSGSHWASVLCCAPYLLTLNPQSKGWDVGESFATQPSMGTVTTGCTPCWRSAPTKPSSVWLSLTFSKYQSLPALVKSFVKL